MELALIKKGDNKRCRLFCYFMTDASEAPRITYQASRIGPRAPRLLRCIAGYRYALIWRYAVEQASHTGGTHAVRRSSVSDPECFHSRRIAVSAIGAGVSAEVKLSAHCRLIAVLIGME